MHYHTVLLLGEDDILQYGSLFEWPRVLFGLGVIKMREFLPYHVDSYIYYKRLDIVYHLCGTLIGGSPFKWGSDKN